MELRRGNDERRLYAGEPQVAPSERGTPVVLRQWLFSRINWLASDRVGCVGLMGNAWIGRIIPEGEGGRAIVDQGKGLVAALGGRIVVRQWIQRA